MTTDYFMRPKKPDTRAEKLSLPKRSGFDLAAFLGDDGETGETGDKGENGKDGQLTTSP